MFSKLSLIFLSLFILCSFSLIIRTPSVKTTIHSAIQSNLVDVSCLSNGKHRGFSVNLELRNTSNKTLELVIPAGTTYLPANDDEQSLIQLEDDFIVLQPNQVSNKKIAAFCYEAHDRCPSNLTLFKISTNSDRQLGQLTDYIKGKSLDKSSFQDAVWAISDRHSIANIEANTPENTALRKYIAQVTGRKDTWYTSPQRVEVDDHGNINRETLLISGEIAFSCPPGTAIQQDICKADGEIFFDSNRTMTARYGKVTYNFNLQVRGWERGGYYIRIHDGDQEYARYEFEI